MRLSFTILVGNFLSVLAQVLSWFSLGCEIEIRSLILPMFPLYAYEFGVI